MPITLDELTVADEPGAWEALGFEVDGDLCVLGDVRIRLAGSGAGRQGAGRLVAARCREHRARRAADDLVGSRAAERVPGHPNGITGIDHVVAITPDLERTIAALEAAGLDLRRIREEPTPAGAPRQAFFRLGAPILEVVQEPADVVARRERTGRRSSGDWR